ncbi:hypothetical protein TNIN_478881 [Trichonephila inaurata madagascariensis]|uniref:Uncharacterized protein n=1 Tax=Trichonephila inaurata madagascariensis TaxID=2747483 RepID=A0A8X6WUF4_9ARAC|nr:hypothetical protein TNIN_478881 [Trichonephila inaurata madagascariensis]
MFGYSSVRSSPQGKGEFTMEFSDLPAAEIFFNKNLFSSPKMWLRISEVEIFEIFFSYEKGIFLWNNNKVQGKLLVGVLDKFLCMKGCDDRFVATHALGVNNYLIIEEFLQMSSKIKRKVTVENSKDDSDQPRRPSVFERLGPGAVNIATQPTDVRFMF